MEKESTRLWSAAIDRRFPGLPPNTAAEGKRR